MPIVPRLFAAALRILTGGMLCCAIDAAAAGPNLAESVIRAQEAANTGDLALARAYLDPVLASPRVPAEARATFYIMRARLFLSDGAPVSARLDAERATQIDPTNGEALSLLARLYRESGVRGADGAANAARLYLKAARQGVVEAQREAGALLLRGDGIAADLRKARYWLERAANAGDHAAMLLLARSYADAADADQRDPVLAANWLQRAGERGRAAAAAAPLGGASLVSAGATGGLDDARQ